MDHTMWKQMKNCARKWCQNLRPFMFEVICVPGKMCHIIKDSKMPDKIGRHKEKQCSPLSSYSIHYLSHRMSHCKCILYVNCKSTSGRRKVSSLMKRSSFQIKISPFKNLKVTLILLHDDGVYYLRQWTVILFSFLKRNAELSNNFSLGFYKWLEADKWIMGKLLAVSFLFLGIAIVSLPS